MYITAQQILDWNTQYAQDRAANRGALTHISAEDPRGWVQGPDFVAPVHTLTGEGYAAEGTATFGLTDPMTLWAQQQSDAHAVYVRTAAAAGSTVQPPVSSGDREPIRNAIPFPTGIAATVSEPPTDATPAMPAATESAVQRGTPAVPGAQYGQYAVSPNPVRDRNGAATEPVTKPPSFSSAANGSAALASAVRAGITVKPQSAAERSAAGSPRPAATASGLTGAAEDTRDRYAKLLGTLAARGLRFDPGEVA